MAVTLLLAASAADAAVDQEKADKVLSAEAVRGRYLVQIAGCNDCHTPGYMAAVGQVDEQLWLTGSKLGFSGPWGTTYAPNLRLLAKDMTADQFMVFTRIEFRPPMPWFNLRVMSDGDVKAIYAYLQQLGPAGEATPPYLPPGQKPEGPVVQFPSPPR